MLLGSTRMETGTQSRKWMKWARRMRLGSRFCLKEGIENEGDLVAGLDGSLEWSLPTHLISFPFYLPSLVCPFLPAWMEGAARGDGWFSPQREVVAPIPKTSPPIQVATRCEIWAKPSCHDKYSYLVLFPSFQHMRDKFLQIFSPLKSGIQRFGLYSNSMFTFIIVR